MVELAHVLRDELSSGNIDSFGPILDENWSLKKVSRQRRLEHGDRRLVRSCDGLGRARREAARRRAGWNSLCSTPLKSGMTISSTQSGLRRVNFAFEPLGSRILFYNPR